MSASALLFFSDRRASAWLSDALHKLGLQVELCSEIFSCLEKLTSRGYDVIAVDCSEGAEALFLLKTARNLKQNQDAFSLILANQRDWSSAQRAGASLILENPIVPEHAMQALLGSDAFLAKMKHWAGRAEKQIHEPATSSAGLKSSVVPSPLAHVTIFAEETLPVEPLASMPDKNSPLARRSINFPSASRLFNLAEDQSFLGSSKKIYSSSSSKTLGFLKMTSVNLSSFTRVAAMIFAFLCFGYSISQPLVASAIFTVATQTYAQTVAEAETLLLNSNQSSPKSEHLSANNSTRRPSQRIYVRAVTSAARVSSQISPGAESPDIPSDEHSQPAQSALGQSVEIPQSLQSPLQQSAAAGPVSARPGSLLARGLGIITLSPEVSQKMLLAQITPEYPAQARQRGLEGAVVVQAVIAADGSIQALKLIRGSLILGAAACEAIRQWRYRPYLLNGQAVEAQTYVTIDFKLPEQMTRGDVNN